VKKENFLRIMKCRPDFDNLPLVVKNLLLQVVWNLLCKLIMMRILSADANRGTHTSSLTLSRTFSRRLCFTRSRRWSLILPSTSVFILPSRVRRSIATSWLCLSICSSRPERSCLSYMIPMDVKMKILDARKLYDTPVPPP
jgi:hypothetical protein